MQYIFPCLLCKVKDGVETERKIYASEQSASRTEFYKADANGYKIEKIMVIRTLEYKGEEILKLGEDRFIILRAYNKQDGTTELSLIKEVKIYDEEVLLMWDIIENGEVIEKSQVAFARYNSLSSNDFNVSYQSGTNLLFTFQMKTIDFEQTKRIDPDTNKPLYATKLQYKGATYHIVKINMKKSIDEIEIICS